MSEEEKVYVTEIITDPEVLNASPNTDGSVPEIPVRIEKHGNADHKTETRIFSREIHESFCDEPTCEFYKKHAAQGHCGKDEAEDMRIYDLIDRREAELEKDWNECYASDPEGSKSAYITAMLNWSLGLDECIKLRAENARLKNKLGEYK